MYRLSLADLGPHARQQAHRDDRTVSTSHTISGRYQRSDCIPENGQAGRAAWHPQFGGVSLAAATAARGAAFQYKLKSSQGLFVSTKIRKTRQSKTMGDADLEQVSRHD